MSFKNLKKKRSNIADLAKQLESGGKKTYDKDERFYYPERDEKGNGYAVIRFLPPADSDSVSWVQMFSHGYQGKNGWYIEECPTTIDQKCPMCDANSELYATLGKEEAQKIVSAQYPHTRKRRMQYVANVYVVEDSATPANEGKVFLFRFGARIMEKVMNAVSPEFPDDVAIDPFDMWEGANFKLKIRKVAGQTNYDSSEFVGETAPLLDSDAKLEKVYNEINVLSDLIKGDTYTPYTDLAAKLNRVMGIEAPKQEQAPTPEPSAAQAPTGLVDSGDEEDEETLAFFKDL